MHTCFLCILNVRNVEGISLDNLVRKNNTLHHYPTPYPPTSMYRLATIWLQTLTSKYSNCICYNFFISCPICMKFSHNILHTYSIILSIIKHNWKIRRFWVGDPLKTDGRKSCRTHPQPEMEGGVCEEEAGGDEGVVGGSGGVCGGLLWGDEGRQGVQAPVVVLGRVGFGVQTEGRVHLSRGQGNCATLKSSQQRVYIIGIKLNVIYEQ